MLEKILSSYGEYTQLIDALQRHDSPAYLTGLSNIHKAHLILNVLQSLDRPILVLVPDEPTATRLTEDIDCFHPGIARLYPTRDFVLRQVEGASREYEHARLRVLSGLLGGECRIVVASLGAALQYTLPPSTLGELTRTLTVGQQVSLEELVAHLIFCGYQRSSQVEGVSQFSLRGGILDFFSPGDAAPIRMEFWGDEIDTISHFDPQSQRRTDSLESVTVSPAREVVYSSPQALISLLQKAQAQLRGKAGVKAKQLIAQDCTRLEEGLSLDNADKYLQLIYPEPATLFSYLPGALVFSSEYVRQKEVLRDASWQDNEDTKILFEEGVLFKGCDTFSADLTDYQRELLGRDTVFIDTFVRTLNDIPIKTYLDISAVQLASWSGEIKLLQEDLDAYLERGFCVGVMAGTQRAAAALASDLQRLGYPADAVPDIASPSPGKVFVLGDSITAGIEYPILKFAVISHARTTAPAPRKKRKKKAGEEIQSLSDLTPGDYVVHASHGIGVFEGIVKRDIHGVVKDYIKIRYAGTDTLFVPVTQLDLVSKYIGPREDRSVKLNKLNSAEWQKTRQRVKKAVADMAQELIKLYAQRMDAKGFAFGEDTDWQREFEERFPFDETEDQLRCIDELKHDMEQPRPMDRLLCGDVGFGKTEVAIRGAFKCVMDSKQCALLVPTTILAWQHFKTFTQRMEGFPITVELLSRFRTPKQQEEILRRLKRGEIDIIIGTHRLVQKDVHFKDLGLCIIDEEQRFGVGHKEKFKELHPSVDVLTLSATPIPRTLNMAMSGIRDMSILEEAPMDRHPVQTYVLEHDWGVVAQAIQKELRRSGQVFYLHNRVETIDSCAAKIKAMVPDARILTAHGKMSEEKITDIWGKLVDHEVDVLVCTTIIETGVDVSNCNTLIIEDADKMGLAQLYQLRGRVGRSNRRAFAYLTFTRGKALSDIATKRLSAVREFTSFGSGFKIAMRDLEIRGAGNILGAQQHGHMEAVGYEMYLRMLSDAIQEQKGEKKPAQADRECQIDIRIGAHIPESYIDNLSQRIDVYKKIATIRSEEDSLDVMDELIDRFGEPPSSVKGLIDVALLRNVAASMEIYEISQKQDNILLFPQNLDFPRASRLSGALPGRVMVSAGAKPYITVRIPPQTQPIDTMREALLTMKKL